MYMQLWLFSDWHFKHENIYQFTNAAGRRIRERFTNAAEGDAYIEQRWRDLVKPSDHIYNLGDCTMYRGKHMSTEFIQLTRSLPGHKRLILGNCHGHTHQHPDESPRYLNISVERTQYEPIPIETAKALLRAKVALAEQATTSLLDVRGAVMDGP